MRLKRFPLPLAVGITPTLRDAHLESLIASAPTHVRWSAIAALVDHSNRRIRTLVRIHAVIHAVTHAP